MPFVQRVIEPKYLSRTSLWDAEGKPRVTDDELEAVVNNTLSNALRQLASLVLVANEIFTDLGDQLQLISKRSDELRVKIGLVEEKVEAYDPKKVAVPEGDICSFAQQKTHYTSKHEFSTNLFSSSSRSSALKELYEAAAKTPVHLMRQMDRWRRDGHRSSRFFLCTPVLGAKRKKIRNMVDIDIETRMPTAVEELRRWTSSEALGDMTVAPDCTNRIVNSVTVTDGELSDGTIASDDEGIDHKLPSPEEQLQVVALKFPAEIVKVDVSGRSFDRLSGQRRSLLHPEMCSRTAAAEGDTLRKRTRNRRPRSRRRNTLAGTDQKEIRDALSAGDQQSSSVANTETESPASRTFCRSRSSDIVRTSSSKRESPEPKKSHFNSLKQWGKNRLKQLNKSSSSKSSSESSRKNDDIDNINIYETVTMKRMRSVDRERKSMHERNPSVSSSEKSSINLPVQTSLSSVMNLAVKLRESSAQRRQRRSGGKDEQPHSSSGNWSASSESGRASVASEITTHPKSTTSTCTSNNSLNIHAPSSVNSRRRFNVNTSASSSVTSEGTLTPDIIHDLHEDGETSSVYSCDTEGYYTSFHMDSGLKTLKEEDLPMTPLHSTTAFSNSSSNNTILTAENEYELFGKGSTSTTTSSAGTVCTALRASESSRSLIIGPAVPERKSSLSTKSNKDSNSPQSSLERDYDSEKTGTVKRSPSSNKATVVAVIHKTTNGDVSPDSGHNTSSSPIESISSPNGMRSGSEFEFSESSDMEGAERVERIRVKTTINSSRIPSMCVITPPVSDDESVKSNNFDYRPLDKLAHISSGAIAEIYNINTEMGAKSIINRPKLELPLSSSENESDKGEDSNKPTLEISATKHIINVNPQSGYATVETIEVKSGSNETVNRTLRAPSPSGGSVTVKEEHPSKATTQNYPVFKASLLPLNNMLGRWKMNLVNMGHRKEKQINKTAEEIDDSLFDSGEYVTIADVRNNNEKVAFSPENTYINDDITQNLNKVLHGKIREVEYVSLNELPCNETTHDLQNSTASSDSLERRKRQGARVTLDADGKVIYSSDSLKKRKSAHTTFEPGPFVKPVSTETESPLPIHRTPKAIRPVHSSQDQVDSNQSAQTGKVVIKAVSGAMSPTSEIVRIPPSTIVTPAARPLSPKPPTTRGAYVHMQDSRPLSPTHEKERVLLSSNQQMNNSLTHFKPGFYQQDMRDIRNNYQSPLVADNMHFRHIGITEHAYHTLPSKKTHNVILEGNRERSVTPDITRGLSNNLTKNYVVTGDQEQINTFLKYHHTPHNPYEQRNLGKPIPVPRIGTPVNIVPSNDIYTPGYKESAHMHYSNDSVRQPLTENSKNNTNESLRISPIDPRNSGSFQSSTPQNKQDLKAAVNLEQKLLSPKKSTMSNDELYAVIHKGKKKMNIEGNCPKPASKEVESPKRVCSPETGYIGDKCRSRLSWSPGKGEYVDFNTDIDKLSPPNDSRSRQSWACSDRKGVQQTSRLDFKKLLLQHGKNSIVPPSTKKLSAVEQLKLSREQMQSTSTKPNVDMTILEYSGSPKSLANRKWGNNGPPSPVRATPEKVRVPAKLLSPRSQWRFSSPRSDVLSSTILEDCREDESPNSSTERKGSKYSKNDAVQPSQGRNMPVNSISERLKAQRAQFFSTGTQNTSSTNSNLNSRFTPSNNDNKQCSSPPTLETAF